MLLVVLDIIDSIAFIAVVMLFKSVVSSSPVGVVVGAAFRTSDDSVTLGELDASGSAEMLMQLIELKRK